MAAFQVSFLSHAFQHSSGLCMQISVWDSRQPAGKGKKVVQESVSWGWKKSLLVIYPNFQQSLLCTHMLEKSLRQFQYDHEICWGRNQELVVCKGGSRPILQESGNKKRAARKVATVVQRVEHAHEGCFHVPCCNLLWTAFEHISGSLLLGYSLKLFS